MNEADVDVEPLAIVPKAKKNLAGHYRQAKSISVYDVYQVLKP
jgi:hypothetical protein